MRRLRLFLHNILFLLAVLLLYRVVFLLSYGDFGSLEPGELLSAFFVGLRFDLSTAAYVLGPLTLIVFFPMDATSERFRKILAALNLPWFVAIIVYLFVDLIYYSYAERHLTFELFNTRGDILPLALIGVRKYLPQVLGLIVFTFLFSLAYLASLRRIFREAGVKGGSGPWKEIALYAANLALVAGLTVVMARGGLQMKPQKISDAYTPFHSAYMGNLAINGVYTSLRTLYSARQNREELWWNVHYMPPEKAAEAEKRRIVSPDREEVPDPSYPLFRHFRQAKTGTRPLNVVVFVMESWTGRYTGSVGGKEDATPFFSRLSKDGMLFRNFFANGQRSIEGISALLTSLPPWGGMILSMNATLSQMPVKFIPSILQDEGYSTFFIHGAKYDSMGFAGLTRHAGLSGYISKKEIQEAGGRDDGMWGIYDEDTFLYANRLFSQQRRPFFSVIFSLSSHTPYKLPSKEFEHYGKETPYADFLNSLRYSDYALSRFFDAAKDSDYFRDTVFVILGDHTEGKSSRESLYDMFHIPCLIYSPAHVSPEVVERPASQVDIAPTILDILKSPKMHASTGMSALTPGKRGQALLAYGDLTVFVKDDWMLLSSVGDPKGLFNYRVAPAADVSAKERAKVLEMQGDLRTNLQFLGDLVSGNRLFPAGRLALRR